jgi:N,N'-diacetyllegionaminate synthase
VITIIAELATAHGGNLDIAKRMIDDAAAAGANLVKTQAYDLSKLNPSDPQAEWLVKAHLSEDDHVALKAHADAQNVRYFASAFDQKSADFVVKLCGIVKFASSVAFSIGPGFQSSVERPESIYKTYPWKVPDDAPSRIHVLVTAPLYPTPLEVVGRVEMDSADGWSDHCVGLAGCVHAFQHGVRLFEVHMSSTYAARFCPWDKTPEQIRQLRDLCDDLETIRTGVSKTFRERWTA